MPRRARRRLPLRARLTATSTALFAIGTSVVLAVAYGILDRHLGRTLPSDLAAPILSDAALQLALTLVGITLLAGAAGWWAAGRALRPLKRVTATARRVSDEQLDERLALDGPRDEVRELADTFDAMLDRLAAGIDRQRRFVANAGHELRTPLTALRTDIEVTLADPDADVAALRRMGEQALGDVDELEGLLASLLALARAQRAPLQRRPVTLDGLVRTALADLPDDAPAVELEAAPAPVVGDPALLARVVANLLDNACRYNRPGGWVRVATERAAGRGPGAGTAVLRVANTGPRVDPDDLERLTAPFERLGRHGDGRNHGLGLSIVAAIVRAHGGDLTLAARPEGGLEVTVRLPGDDADAPSYAQLTAQGVASST
jgi:signal transduction histidine kinase